MDLLKMIPIFLFDFSHETLLALSQQRAFESVNVASFTDRLPSLPLELQRNKLPYLWTVAFLDGFSCSLLDKRNLALLLKHLVANFFLDCCELCHVCVVTFFNVPVGAGQNWFLLDSLYNRHLLNA